MDEMADYLSRWRKAGLTERLSPGQAESLGFTGHDIMDEHYRWACFLEWIEGRTIEVAELPLVLAAVGRDPQVALSGPCLREVIRHASDEALVLLLTNETLWSLIVENPSVLIIEEQDLRALKHPDLSEDKLLSLALNGTKKVQKQLLQRTLSRSVLQVLSEHGITRAVRNQASSYLRFKSDA